MAVGDSVESDIHDRRLRYRSVSVSLVAMVDVNEYSTDRQTDRQTDNKTSLTSPPD
jgi:hypothetical protein